MIDGRLGDWLCSIGHNSCPSVQGRPAVERLNRHSSDSVSEFLRGVRVQSTVYCVSDLRAPWGLSVEDSSVAKFHLVLEGSCVLSLDGRDDVALGPGELVLLLSGSGHTLRDRPRSRVRRLERILSETPVDGDGRLAIGGRGRRTRLVCGGFVLAEPLPAGLILSLPDVLRLDAGVSGLNRWLEPLFAMLRDETDGSRPGAAAVFGKIADVFLAQVLRTYLISAEESGLVHLAPLQDPAVAGAVELIRNRPQVHWTVAALAREVSMSRTAFAARFGALVGTTPIAYLTRVRLSQAAGYLTTTDQSLYAIARRVGYDSEASFSKAFKRGLGRSPGEYRRQSATRPVRIVLDAG